MDISTLNKWDLIGREFVIIESVPRVKWKLSGRRNEFNFEIVRAQFEKLGFALSGDDKKGIALFSPKGWTIIREQRFHDLFFLTFYNSKMQEKASVACKTSDDQKYVDVNFDVSETSIPQMEAP